MFYTRHPFGYHKASSQTTAVRKGIEPYDCNTFRYCYLRQTTAAVEGVGIYTRDIFRYHTVHTSKYELPCVPFDQAVSFAVIHGVFRIYIYRPETTTARKYIIAYVRNTLRYFQLCQATTINKGAITYTCNVFRYRYTVQFTKTKKCTISYVCNGFPFVL